MSSAEKVELIILGFALGWIARAMVVHFQVKKILRRINAARLVPGEKGKAAT